MAYLLLDAVWADLDPLDLDWAGRAAFDTKALCLGLYLRMFRP